MVLSDVTAAVVAGRAGVELVDLGIQRLRGVAEPMRAFGVRAEGLTGWNDAASTAAARPAPSARARSNLPAEDESQPFVGRHAELQTLREWWRHQTTRMLLVTGEAGVGKTRLATAFAREVERAGVPVLYGRAVEAEGSSYEPVLGALRQFIASDSGLDRAGGDDLGCALASAARGGGELPRRGWPSGGVG